MGPKTVQHTFEQMCPLWYARGSLAFIQGDYDRAEQLMQDASSIPASRATLDEIARIRANKQQKVTKIELK